MALLTQAEYARRRGVSRQAVSKAVKKGRIPTVKGKIDPSVADREFEANADRQHTLKAASESPPAAPNYSSSRAIREAFMANLARLDYQKRTGALVSAEEVKTAAFNTARKARDLLLALPDRLAPVLAGLDDPLECHRVMTEEIRRVCDELSGH